MISICKNKEEHCSKGSSLEGKKSSKSWISGSFKERTHSSCLALSWGGFMMLFFFCFFFSCKSWHQHSTEVNRTTSLYTLLKGGKLKKIWGQRKKERLKRQLRKRTSTQIWIFLKDEISLRNVCGCMDRNVKVKNEQAVFCYICL